MPFEDYIQQNNHQDTCTRPTHTDTTFFDDLLRINHMDKHTFCMSIHNLMNKKLDRVNTLCIEGPTTTGKSLFLKMICQNHQFGTV